MKCQWNGNVTKIKIEGTIDKRVFEEFKRVYVLEVERAEVEDRVQPSVSHVLEMLLRKGIKTYETDKKTGSKVSLHR
jgi:hypothetical protein